MGLNKEGLYNGVKPPEEDDQKISGKTLRKNHYSIRKNTIRNNHFIQELTPRIPLEITNSPKKLALKLEFIIWLCVLFSSDKLLAFINCCKTHHQPNSFTHSLINLLYWAYWAHILFYLGSGYDLWPYNIYIYIYIHNEGLRWSFKGVSPLGPNCFLVIVYFIFVVGPFKILAPSSQ